MARVMAKAKILIADDESTSRRGLQELLGSWGYEVAAAADGEEALEKASEFRPALVITQQQMDGALDVIEVAIGEVERGLSY